VLGIAAAVVSGAESARPNVIYVFTDQQHAGMMSCAGNTDLKTPAMDSLAKTGARFERAYSANPVCVPSRVAMLTGHFPSRFGMQSNAELGTTKIPEPVLQHALGSLFRSAGYRTVYGGKTHVPGKIDQYGFEVLTGDQRQGLADSCVEFLKQKHDRPFLLVASFINPHDICYMAINDFELASGGKRAKGKATRSLGKKEQSAAPHQLALAEALQPPPGVSQEDFLANHLPPLPANLEPPKGEPEVLAAASHAAGFRAHAFANWGEQQWRLHRWAYCRLTERVDRELGQVLQTLRETGLENNTLVVLSSDHGDHDGAHRLEHKSTFYEEAARVPFIVSLKGVTKPGLVDRTHVVSSGLDLIPTLCDFAGITVPPDRSQHPRAGRRPRRRALARLRRLGNPLRPDGLLGPLQVLRLRKRCESRVTRGPGGRPR
jgi:choline-sulfatase